MIPPARFSLCCPLSFPFGPATRRRARPSVLHGQVTFANGTVFCLLCHCRRVVIPLAANLRTTGSDSPFWVTSGTTPNPKMGWQLLLSTPFAMRLPALSVLNFTQFWNCLDWDLRPGLCHTQTPAEKEELKAPSRGESVASSVRSDGLGSRVPSPNANSLTLSL